MLNDQSWPELQKNFELLNDTGAKIRYLEAMILKAPSPEAVAELRYKLGQCYAEEKKWKNAEQEYEKSTQLAPGSTQAEQAFFQQIVSSFEQVLVPNRDQTKTHETLELANRFLTQHENSMYAPAVKEIAMKCKTLIAMKEQLIIQDQVTRKDYLSALGRIEEMKKKHAEDFPDLISQLVPYEQQIPEPYVQTYEQHKKMREQAHNKETTLA